MSPNCQSELIGVESMVELCVPVGKTRNGLRIQSIESGILTLSKISS